MNAMIAALTNYLYVTLSKKDFIFWNVFFSELSKSMFGMEILRSICYFSKEKGHHGHRKHEGEGWDDDDDEPIDYEGGE
jgi:hypothetical protein